MRDLTLRMGKAWCALHLSRQNPGTTFRGDQ